MGAEEVQPAVVRQAQAARDVPRASQQEPNVVEPNNKLAPRQTKDVTKNSNSSRFSLKNGAIRFGMSKEEYDNVAKEDGKGYSFVAVGGLPLMPTFDASKNLESFFFSFPTDPNMQDLEIHNVIDLITKKYGKPTDVIKNGEQIYLYTWKVQDVVIRIKPVQWNPKTNKFASAGFAQIQTKEADEKSSKAQDDRQASRAKDFQEGINEEIEIRIIEMRMNGYEL